MKRLSIVLGLILFLAIILFGARGTLPFQLSIFGQAEPEPPINLASEQIHPRLWKIISRKPDPINIDGDEDTEWLVFYRYDNGNIGGVVYDPQTVPLGMSSVPLPDQPATFLVPYQLLPDYQWYKDSGYLGDDDVEFRTADSMKGEAQPASDRLLVRGLRNNYVTRFSSFWWIDSKFGYGGSHISTRGWLSLSHEFPHDWQVWKDKRNFPDITTVWAWEPLGDRSYLCQRHRWQLNPNPDPDSGEAEGRFDYFAARFQRDASNDITFCSGAVPEEPAYPEGQVLAYIHDAKRQRLVEAYQENELFPQFKGAIVEGISNPDLPAPATLTSEPQTITVDVEVTLKRPEDAQPWTPVWTLIMIRPQNIQDTIQWRIANVAPR